MNMDMDIDTSVEHIMTRRVVAVSPDTPVTEVARLMWQHAFSGVPVVDDGQVVGVISEYDLISQQAAFDAPLYVTFLDAYFRVPGTGDEEQLRRILATTAKELMTSPPVTAKPNATVQDVATLMYERRVNPVPIVDDDGTLLGIVSRADIIHLMVREEEAHRSQTDS